MKARIELTKDHVNTLKNIYKILEDSNVELVFDKEGLSFELIDRTYVSYMKFKLPKKEFLEFSARKDKILVSLPELIKSIKLGVNVFEKNDSCFIVSGNKVPIIKKDDLAYWNDLEIPPIDDLEHNVSFEMGFMKLREIVKMFNNEEKISIETTKDGIVFRGEVFSVERKYTDLQDQKTSYPVEYLKKMFYFLVDEVVTIKFKNFNPCRIEGKYFTYVLAPRVSEEDEEEAEKEAEITRKRIEKVKHNV